MNKMAKNMPFCSLYIRLKFIKIYRLFSYKIINNNFIDLFINEK